MLVHILVSWLVSALALWLVAQIVSGIELSGFGAAMLATIVIGIVDAIIGPVLRFLAFPLTFLTLGLFRWVIYAFLLNLASLLTPGFRIRGFLPALLGGLLLALLNYVLHRLVF